MSDDPASARLTTFLSGGDTARTTSGMYARLRALKATGRVGDALGLSSQSVIVPPPLPFPENLGEATGADFLVKAYVSAVAWSELPNGVERLPMDRLKYVVSAQLKGKVGDIVQALHTLRETSKLSPVIWAWWRIQSNFEYQRKSKGDTAQLFLPSAAVVFDPKRFLDPQLRAMFWKDGMGGVHENQILWPKAIIEVLAISRDFDDLAMSSTGATDDELASVWHLMYEARFQELARECAAQRVHIRNKITAAVQRQDAGLWLSQDLVAHLKLQKEATIRLVA